jgi:glycerol-3-phosphate dehydrogenase
MERIGVIGAGAWGTALALAARRTDLTDPFDLAPRLRWPLEEMVGADEQPAMEQHS